MKSIFYLGFIFILSLVLTFLHVNFIIIVTVSMLIIFLGVLYPTYYALFWSKDCQKIERFLYNNRKNPLFDFYYALANCLDEEIEHALEKVLKKYKQQQKQALFKTIYALYQEDLEKAKDNVNDIKPDVYQQYYHSVIAIKENDFEKANSYITNITIDWMKDALHAEIALANNDLQEAEAYARKALSKTKGIQYYGLQKTFEREIFTKLKR